MATGTFSKEMERIFASQKGNSYPYYYPHGSVVGAEDVGENEIGSNTYKNQATKVDLKPSKMN